MSNANIKTMMETVQRIFEASKVAVEGLAVGERIQIKELAQTVGLAVAMEPKHVLGFVNHFVHNTDIAYVTRGKNGGVVRGTKSTNAKPAKKSKKADSTDSTSV